MKNNLLQLVILKTNFLLMLSTTSHSHVPASVIFANHYLISHGGGFLVIPEKEVPEYRQLLAKYYEGEDIAVIAAFIKERCRKTTEL